MNPPSSSPIAATDASEKQPEVSKCERCGKSTTFHPFCPECVEECCPGFLDDSEECWRVVVRRERGNEARCVVYASSALTALEKVLDRLGERGGGSVRTLEIHVEEVLT